MCQEALLLVRRLLQIDIKEICTRIPAYFELVVDKPFKKSYGLGLNCLSCRRLPFIQQSIHLLMIHTRFSEMLCLTASLGRSQKSIQGESPFHPLSV